jgi:cytoskeletal protein CcmA (bactofilin family)
MVEEEGSQTMSPRRNAMWKKDEQPEQYRPVSQSEGASPRAESSPAPTRKGSERAAIGPSITIRGEVSGDEDLLIQGRVDGSVDLKQHTVTVGREGQVKAGISARVVTVEGKVQGDLVAEEQVILRSSARVEGDITAPRVILEDGANFRGGVDMGESTGRSPRRDAGHSRDERKSPEPKKTSTVAEGEVSEKASSAAAS